MIPPPHCRKQAAKVGCGTNVVAQITAVAHNPNPPSFQFHNPSNKLIFTHMSVHKYTCTLIHTSTHTSTHSHPYFLHRKFHKFVAPIIDTQFCCNITAALPQSLRVIPIKNHFPTNAGSQIRLIGQNFAFHGLLPPFFVQSITKADHLPSTPKYCPGPSHPHSRHF